MTPENQALFQGPNASRHRDGQLIVSRLGSDTVETMNHARITETTNQAATAAPRITEHCSASTTSADTPPTVFRRLDEGLVPRGGLEGTY